MLTILLLLVLVSVLFYCVVWFKKRSLLINCGFESIPGAIPVLGHGYQLGKSEMGRDNPIQWIYEQVAKCDFKPMVFSGLWLDNAVIVSDPLIVQEFLKRERDKGNNIKRSVHFEGDTFALGGETLFSLRDQEKWKHRRKLLNPMFSTPKLKRMFTSVKQTLGFAFDIVDEHCRTGETLDLLILFERITMDVISTFIFGKSFRTLQTEDSIGIGAMYHEVSKEVFLYANVPFYQFYPGRLNFTRARGKFVRGVLGKCIEEATDSSVAGKLRDSGSISQQDLEKELFGLIFAGHETTKGTLGFLFGRYLKGNKDVTDDLLESVKSFPDDIQSWTMDCMKNELARSCYKEALRLSPPALLHPVVTQEAQEVGGVVYPAHVPIFLLYYATFRRKDYFGADADVFRPSRWTDGVSINTKDISLASLFVPFLQISQHNCLGKPLAEMELMLFTQSFVKRYEFDIINTCKDRVKITLGPDQVICKVTRR